MTEDRMPSKRLTVALPEDVWKRLEVEALAKGISIGTHARRLIVKRDERMQATKETGQ